MRVANFRLRQLRKQEGSSSSSSTSDDDDSAEDDNEEPHVQDLETAPRCHRPQPRVATDGHSAGEHNTGNAPAVSGDDDTRSVLNEGNPSQSTDSDVTSHDGDSTIADSEDGFESSDSDTDGGMYQHNPAYLKRKLRRIRGKLMDIKFSTNVPDIALEKLFRFACDHGKDLSLLLEAGYISKSYRHSVKPKEGSIGPKIVSRAVTEETIDGSKQTKTYDNLQRLPNKLIRPRLHNPVKLLRIESKTTLAEIKKHFLAKHPRLAADTDSTATALQNCILSIDGVRVAQHSSRTMYVFTLKIKQDLYIWKVICPLKNDTMAKPSVRDLLQ